MDKLRYRPILLALCCIGLLSAGACAPLSEAQFEARQYRQIEYQNRFLDFRQQCWVRGKRVFIEARGRVGNDRLPAYGDKYFCY